jgi:aldose 1-epimerase
MKSSVKTVLSASAVALTILSACSNNKTESSSSQDSLSVAMVDSAKFDTTINGKAVKIYTLTNKNNMKAVFTNLGGRIISLMVPDSAGKLTDVVVGFGSAEAYQKSTEPYFGATIGR